jgi:hypothetical protein
LATATIYANKEHSVADTNTGLDVGTSKEKHGPIGDGNSDWQWRELIKFPMSVSDFNGITQITTAVLKFKTTSEVHATNDANILLYVNRLTAAFAATGGGASDASDSWKTGADPNWATKPSSTSTGQGTKSFSPANSTVYQVDITDIVEYWAPASIKKRDGTPCTDGSNYGVMMRSADEANGKSMEIQTMRNSYSPRVVVTGTTTPVPQAPVNLAPSGTLSAIPTAADFSWDGDAADENPLTSWDFQLDDEIGFATPLLSLTDQTTGISGVDVAAPTLTGLSLSRGTTYYWRVRHENSEGVNGSWSDIQSFYVEPLPDAPTLVNPTVAKPNAPVSNLGALAVWTGSEGIPLLKFTYHHPDGLAISGYTIEWDSTEYETNLFGPASEGEPGEGVTFEVAGPVAVARNTAKNYRVKCKDENGNYGPYSSTVACKVQWAQGVFAHTHGAGAGNLTFDYTAVSGGDVAFAFRKSDGTPGPWVSSIGNVTPSTSVQVLVRLATDDSTSNPTLPDMTLEYVATGDLPPDLWEVEGTGGTIVLDSNLRRFGRRSCKVTPGTAATYVSPTYGTSDPYIIVTPGETYTFSVYIFSDSAGSGHLRFHDGADAFIEQTAITHGAGSTWERFSASITVPAGVTRIRPIVRSEANDPVYWLDSAQFEEGELTTQWSPGGIGPAVSIDVGGVQIDATKGGILRLLTSLGASLTMGSEGLQSDGDFVLDAVGDDLTLKATDELRLRPGVDMLIQKHDATSTWWQLLGADGHLLPFTSVTVNIGAPSKLVKEIHVRDLFATTISAQKPAVYKYTTNDTHVVQAGCAYLTIECVGGGGAGGGTSATGAGEHAAGGGGGGGGYARKVIDADNLSSSIAVTIGAGGTGVSDGTGNTGGNTTAVATGMTTVQGDGGVGGGRGNDTTGNSASGGGAGGSHSGGDIGRAGDDGGNGGVSAGGRWTTGFGGGSMFGGSQRSGLAGTGTAGNAYGGGGAGSTENASSSATAGGAGAAGVVIITEYFV